MRETRPKLLLVEDNADNRMLMLDIIKTIPVDVIEAHDGNEAVAMAKAHKPDLILMDLSLPDKDGWTATQEIKAIDELASITIVALTAHAMKGDRERALQVGCDDYLTKPIRFRELMDKLKILLKL